MKYMYELDYNDLDIDKEKFMANLEELHYKEPRNYYYSLEAIFKRLGDLDDGENIASILDECKLIYENGIECGYGKFVFFSDTKQFFCENKEVILEYLDYIADGISDTEGYSLVDFICEYKEGKKYLEDFIYDPEENCGSLYNLLVWIYVQFMIDSLMEEDSEELLKGAIK
ncbi:hypothetical protein CVIC8964_1322 [Campylobacter vicugnae]|uniref:Uncharacterized protein n=1 Tax=Campylobacter vicugnae TaxID=1660076 RepID=A0A1X9T2L5_9BACT|nr:hypothetical protein [Campylobacter sp. RM8964]ARR02711.1 hypothetical protein CVIC8964_1322 [Campylobacter sp. RM8964]